MRRTVRFLIRLDDVLEVLVFAALGALKRNARTVAAIVLVGATLAATLPRPHHHHRHRCHGAASTNPRVIAALTALKHEQVRLAASSIAAGYSTTPQTFHQRWYQVDSWLKSLQSVNRPLPMREADLIAERLLYYSDPRLACQHLDALIVRVAF